MNISSMATAEIDEDQLARIYHASAPSQSSTQHGQIRFNSYLKYLQYLKEHNVHFEWLYNFFAARPAEPDSALTIWDCVGGNFRCRRDVSRQVMQQPEPFISTRIVISGLSGFPELAQEPHTGMLSGATVCITSLFSYAKKAGSIDVSTTG